MNHAEFTMLLAVLQEMLGIFFWPLLIATVMLTLLFAVLLIKERKIVSRRLLWAEVGGFFGGWFALWLMAKLSASRFTDAGGPIDWLIICTIYGIGFCGTAILLYTASGWLGGCQHTCVCRKESV